MKNDLFILVKSLSPSELRYYTVQQAGSQNKAFMRVFDWMSQLDEYDDTLAEKAFAGESFLKQFGVLKNYLKESLLDALRSYHKSKSPLIQLRNRVDYIELLFHRGQYNQAQKEARGALRIAEGAGYLGIQIECLKWEIRLSRLQKKGEERVTKLRARLMTAAQQEIMEAEVSAAFDEIFHLLLKRPQSTSSEPSPSLVALQSTALQMLENNLDLHAQVILQQVFAYIYLLWPDMKKVNKHYQQAIALVEGSKNYQKFRPDLALNLYTSYLESCFLNHIFDQTERITQLMVRLPSRSRTEKARLETIIVSVWVQHHIQREDFSSAADFEPKVKNLVETYGDRIPPTYGMTLIHNLNLSLFLDGRYTSCKKWLGYTLNQSPSPNRMDIWEFARLLFPVILWELKEVELLHYEIRNSERFFARRGQLSRFESSILQFLKACIKTISTPEETAIRNQFRETLKELEAEHKNQLGYAAIVKWI